MLVTKPQLTDLLRIAAENSTEPVVVGISGYGGAGKSTLARELSESIEGSTVIGVDEYYVIEKNLPDDDWNAFERDRFRDEIARRVAEKQPLILCEGVGIFHPDTVDCFSIRIWVDTDLDVATERGMIREREEGRFDLDDVWRDIWRPNEIRFEAKHNPKTKAHYFVPGT